MQEFLERLRLLELTNAALQEELRKTQEVGEELYRHNRHTARREAEEVAPLPPPHPPTRGDPEPPDPRLFGTHSGRATAWRERRAGLGQALPAGSPIVGSRSSQYRAILRSTERRDWCPLGWWAQRATPCLGSTVSTRGWWSPKKPPLTHRDGVGSKNEDKNGCKKCAARLLTYRERNR